MRAAAWLGILTAISPVVALAGPTPNKGKPTPAVASAKAQRKDVPPGVIEAAASAFAQAREADEAGDLARALSLYLKAANIAPHPNTRYNIADVYRRMKRYHEAIDAYRRYLADATDPPDRAAVEAIITELAATPGTLEIGAQDTDEHAFLDGDPIGLLPQTVDVPEGQHLVEVITPISYGWMMCHVRMGQKETCTPAPAPRMDGNVVMSGSHRVSGLRRWRDSGAMFVIRERFELRHGHYTVGSFVDHQCKSFEIDVPRDESVVTYIYATIPDEYPKHGECDPVLSVKVHTVKL